MAAKGKKKSKKIVQQTVEESSSEEEEVDLETMERMLNDEGSSEEDASKDEESDNDDDSTEENDDENEEEEDDDEDVMEGEEQDNVGVIEDDEDEEIPMGGEEKCNVDLKNLLAFNTHQVNHRALYKKSSVTDESTEIFVDGMKIANEDHLLQKASEGCTQLLAGLWKLETERTDAGPRAILPSYYETVTPRELPPPALKTETRWEKFAKERGIAPKEKRSRKVWDEATGEWAYRTGYQKASSENDPMSWPIMEVRKNQDPFEDPWERARDAKKTRVDKNTMNRMKNAESSGEIARGTTRRIMKAKLKERKAGREGGSLDMKNFSNTPAGVPVDMSEKQRGKELTKLALLATQRSTASMGKFDKMREGEPERRKAMSGLKKRKFESATAKEGVKNEAKSSLKVLENVMTGGGRKKELAIRRGDHARGETGHDFDFDDGLGSSRFRKKKGRAGIGKMKKVTKKTAKMAR